MIFSFLSHCPIFKTMEKIMKKIKVFFLASLLIFNLFFLGCDAKEKIEQIDKVVKKQQEIIERQQRIIEDYKRTKDNVLSYVDYIEYIIILSLAIWGGYKVITIIRKIIKRG